MSAIHLLDYKAALWKSYPSPFDVHVRRIMVEKKDHPLYSKFLSVYIGLRNFLFNMSVEEIYRRRKNTSTRRNGPPNGDIWYNFEELRTLVFMMDEGLMTENFITAHETRLMFMQQGMGLQYINLMRSYKGLLTRRYLYSSCKPSELQSWYDYVRKLLGVYNVPRDDLADRQAQRKATQESRKAFLDRAKEIIESKKAG